MTVSGRWGMLMISLVGLTALVLPLFIQADPLGQDLSLTLSPPGEHHLLGTDHLGRSVFDRIIYGGRTSLAASLLCTALSLTVGTLFGVAAGYSDGWTDLVIMRLVDGALAFPGTLLAIVLAGLFGGSMATLVIALSATMWCDYCRLVRNMVRSLKQADHFQAGQLLGFDAIFMVRRYLVPGILPQVLNLASLNMGRTILNIAGLGFLGIGLQPPSPEWGAMINQGIAFMSEAPWLVIAPGVMIFITVFGFQLLAGALPPQES